MGDVLVRCSRADDSAYMIWSTVVDAPTWIFENRAEAEKHLVEQWRFTHPAYDENGHPYTPEGVVSVPGDPFTPTARLQRADTRGSSSLIGSYGWDDEEFIVMEFMVEQREPGTWLTLRRERLQEFALAMLDGDEHRAGLLLDVHRYEDND